MRWFKIWVDELMTGTTLKELDGDEFKVWIYLLCYASKSKNNPGIVEICDGVPYPIETLATLLLYPVDKFKKILKKLEEVEKIRILPDGRIEIPNFKRYQSIYERYYKQKKKGEKEEQEPEPQKAEAEEKEKQSPSEKKSNQLSPSQVEDLFFSKVEEDFRDFDHNIRELIFETIKVLPLTRKSGRIASTFIEKFLESLKKYDEETIKEGLSKYLEKKMYEQGKKENYLLGILRGLKHEKELRAKMSEKSQKEERRELEKKLEYLTKYIAETQENIKGYEEELREHPDDETTKQFLKDAKQYLRDAIEEKRRIEKILKKENKKRR
jgi:hypothetical protein